MDVRKRHVQKTLSVPSEGDIGNLDESGNLQAEKLDRKFTKLISVVTSVVLIVTSLAVIYPEALEGWFESLGIRTREQAVIIDAGSTGSRVLGFSFRRGLFDRKLTLVDELWMEVKPGLSSFSDEPTKAAESIEKLLKAARDKIPQKYWSETPVVLKATAGLRLLPSEQADAIIREVERPLLSSEFMPHSPLVEIMNPRDEGLFGWFTVNFLLDIFSSGSLHNSYASLDLGGGSTQITFVPRTNPFEGGPRLKHFLHEVNVVGSMQEVYTHSYLGLGLNAARRAVFTHHISEEDEYSDSDDIIDLASPCMTSPQTWSFHGFNYNISAEQPDYQTCLKAVQTVISGNNVHVPKELVDHKIAAFSYFYDRAIDTGILPVGTPHGVAKINQFVEAARKSCADPSSGFLCLDLTFISSLLIDGYGLKPEKEIHLFKKINGYEASWALGVAYYLIEGH